MTRREASRIVGKQPRRQFLNPNRGESDMTPDNNAKFAAALSEWVGYEMDEDCYDDFVRTADTVENFVSAQGTPSYVEGTAGLTINCWMSGKKQRRTRDLYVADFGDYRLAFLSA